MPKITFADSSKTVEAKAGQNILEVALDHGIDIEHACGGVCACSTCHVYIDEGLDEGLSEPEDNELDMLDNAPALKMSSRLSCQSILTGKCDIVVRVPTWNRNLAKEGAKGLEL